VEDAVISGRKGNASTLYQAVAPPWEKRYRLPPCQAGAAVQVPRKPEVRRHA
jgi:hypothetical protein